MDIFQTLRPTVLLGLLTIAAVTDIKQHRVSNIIIATGLIAEGLVHVLSHPVIAGQDLSISLLFIMVLFILFVLRLIGGADVKLYALCIFTYPNETGFRIICLSIISAAVYSLYIMLKPVPAAQQPDGLGVYADKSGRPDKAIVPMAVFIFAGAIMAAVC